MVVRPYRQRLKRFLDNPVSDHERRKLLGERADWLRAHMTLAEERLWHHLKQGHPTRAHLWTAQKVIGWFIVDFHCARKRLVIEVDGGYHETMEQLVKDARRDESLKKAGYRVLRVTNSDVMDALAFTLHRIRREAQGCR